MKLGDVRAAFLPVVKQFLANAPWSEIALVEVRIVYCKQKKIYINIIIDIVNTGLLRNILGLLMFEKLNLQSITISLLNPVSIIMATQDT